MNTPEFGQNLIMKNHFNQLQKQTNLWNSPAGNSITNPIISELLGPKISDPINTVLSQPNEDQTNPMEEIQSENEPLFLGGNATEERLLYEKEKAELEAAENYMKNVGDTENYYLPISATKYVKNPELFTNNAEYHRDYIFKYFNHIPDYETFNVTTEDGVNFPYVTIPNLVVRPNIQSFK